MTVGFTHSAVVTANDVTEVCANFDVSGANRLLVVGVGARRVSSSYVSAVRFGGTDFTLAASATNLNRFTSLWYLIAPSVGSGPILVTYGALVSAAGVGIMQFVSADQTTPIGDVAGNAGIGTAKASAATSIASGWLAVDSVAVGNPVSAHNTLRFQGNPDGAPAYRQLGSTIEGTAGVVSGLYGDLDTGEQWAIVIAAMRAFSAAAGGVTVSPGATDIVIAPQAANIAAGKSPAPGASDILVAIQAPNIAAGKTIVPGDTNIIVAGQAPTVSIPVLVQPGETPIIVAPQAPTIAAGKVLSPGATEIVVAPQDASPAAGKTVSPGETNVIVAGQDPIIIAGSPIIQPDATDILINGQAPTIAAGKTVAPGETDIVISVQDAEATVVAVAAASSRRFSVYRGKSLRHTESVRDFEKNTGDEFVSDESE